MKGGERNTRMESTYVKKISKTNYSVNNSVYVLMSMIAISIVILSIVVLNSVCHDSCAKNDNGDCDDGQCYGCHSSKF